MFSLANMGFILGASGMKDEALKVLERMDDMSKERYVGPLYRGLVWIGFGEKDKALEYLEKACEGRESALAFLKVWPVFDSLRSEPRFQELLKKMNLDK
jgi:tetratricopeptide (TPR) repeat protein